MTESTHAFTKHRIHYGDAQPLDGPSRSRLPANDTTTLACVPLLWDRLSAADRRVAARLSLIANLEVLQTWRDVGRDSPEAVRTARRIAWLREEFSLDGVTLTEADKVRIAADAAQRTEELLYQAILDRADPESIAELRGDLERLLVLRDQRLSRLHD